MDIKLRSRDIDYVEVIVKQITCKHSYEVKDYFKNVIHLNHKLDLEAGERYRVITDEFIMNGYLLSDGLTIVEY